MPRRTAVVEDDDDAVPLNDLLRTGEASRLRRRGALRATAARRDDEEVVPPLPFTRGLKGDESSLELECGVRLADYLFAPAGPSRPSPLPRPPPLRNPSDLGFVFSSSGCGAVISTKAFPSGTGHHVYTATDSVNSDIALLQSQYLEPEQRALADTLTKETCGCKCEWEAVGCRICGNALGFRYAACHPRHANSDPIYVFFSSAVTPTSNFTFPPPQHPDTDDMSIDSPTFSPRVTRYFRSDDEFWPSEMNPTLWTPDHRYIPTPPRSPPSAATPLAYAWRTVLPARASALAQTQDSQTTEASRRYFHAMTLPPVIPSDDGNNDWVSFLRSVSPSRIDAPQQNTPTNDSLQHSEELPPPPSHTGTTRLPREQEDHTSPERRGIPHTDPVETNPRLLDPPSLHRVARRSMPPVTRRPPSQDWSTRGRHTFTSDVGASWGTQGSEERFSRGTRSSRRITMPIPAPPPAPPPPPAFTLLGASGEQTYPPSARSSLDMRDTLGVGGEMEREDALFAQWLMQGHQGASPVERVGNPDPNGDTEEGEGDESDEKEDDLDERRVERTSRNDGARADPHPSRSWGLIAR